MEEDGQEKDSNIQEAADYGTTVRYGLFSSSPIISSRVMEMVRDQCLRPHHQQPGDEDADGE